MYIILNWYFIHLGNVDFNIVSYFFLMLEIAYNFYITLIKLVTIKKVIQFVIIIT